MKYPWVQCTVAGAITALSAAPVEWAGCAFVGVAIWHNAISKEPEPRERSMRKGALCGLAFGIGMNAAALYWAVGLLQDFASMPLVAALPVAGILVLAQSLAYFSAGLAAAALRWPTWLILPMCITVSSSLVPALFPFGIASGQVAWIEFAQVAELGGRPLLDFVLCLAACSISESLCRPRLLPAAIGVFCVVTPHLYGMARLPQIQRARQRAPLTRVGVVQPNIGIFEKRDSRLAPAHLVQLKSATRQLEHDGAELVVWPETAYPLPLHRAAQATPEGVYSLRTDEQSGPLIFGAITVAATCDRWNSAVAMDAHGRFRGTVDKAVLLAFGEYVPFWHWLPVLQSRFRCPGLRSGTTPGVLVLKEQRVGILNCYEDVLAGYTRAVVARRPNWLLNLTNDAWFGDTTEPALHHMVARLRSIETRRDLVRAVNTGVSGHVSATGENTAITNTYQRAAFIAEVRSLGGTTPWTRFGDWLTWALCGVLLALLLLARAKPTVHSNVRGAARSRYR